MTKLLSHTFKLLLCQLLYIFQNCLGSGIFRRALIQCIWEYLWELQNSVIVLKNLNQWKKYIQGKIQWEQLNLNTQVISRDFEVISNSA
jgi:hypothetical protein